MNGNLAQFGEDLRLQLRLLQASVSNMNLLFAGNPGPSQPEIAGRLTELEQGAKAASEREGAVREAVLTGLERHAAISPDTLARWTARRQTAQLHARADQIEQLAAAAVELAMLSTLNAERLIMIAIRARQEAIALQIQRDGGM